jgi:hypothetical protein
LVVKIPLWPSLVGPRSSLWRWGRPFVSSWASRIANMRLIAMRSLPVVVRRPSWDNSACRFPRAQKTTSLRRNVGFLSILSGVKTLWSLPLTLRRPVNMTGSGPPSSLGKSSMLFFPFWRLDAKGGEVASRL